MSMFLRLLLFVSSHLLWCVSCFIDIYGVVRLYYFVFACSLYLLSKILCFLFYYSINNLTSFGNDWDEISLEDRNFLVDTIFISCFFSVKIALLRKSECGSHIFLFLYGIFSSFSINHSQFMYFLWASNCFLPKKYRARDKIDISMWFKKICFVEILISTFVFL